MDVPGLRPISPLTVVAPVFVMVDPARTAKFTADNRVIGVGPAAKENAVPPMPDTYEIANSIAIHFLFMFFMFFVLLVFMFL